MLPADSPFASLPTPGPHPATAELRAYAASTLSAADEHRIEAHILDCERCAELLEGFSMSDAATTDQALAGLRARLQARVADDVTAPILLPASRPLWPRLAAGVALLGAVGAGLWGWEHQRPTAELATAPHETAAPVAKPKPAAPAAVATTKLPEPAAAPRPAASVSAAAPRRQADYAAVRPRRRAAGPVLRRPALPAAPVLAAHDVEASKAAAGLVNQAVPAADYDAKKLAGRSASTSAPNPSADEAAAPQVAASAPAAPAKTSAQADSTTGVQQEAISSRFSKAKSFESAALVRDKPMPATVAIAPAPVTGTPALNAYFRREAAKFEPEEGARSLNGSVRLRFIVGADGKLSNLQVVRGMRADYDEEALRLVCEGPAWRAGVAGGRRAALPVEVSISF